MEIRTGAAVYSRDGEKVGEVGRIVLDGRTDEVTHIVVSKGWLLRRDILVAREDIADVAENSVRLRLDKRQIEARPDFIVARVSRTS